MPKNKGLGRVQALQHLEERNNQVAFSNTLSWKEMVELMLELEFSPTSMVHDGKETWIVSFSNKDTARAIGEQGRVEIGRYTLVPRYLGRESPRKGSPKGKKALNERMESLERIMEGKFRQHYTQQSPLTFQHLHKTQVASI